MQAKALVDQEDDNLPEVEAERHWDILGDVKATSGGGGGSRDT